MCVCTKSAYKISPSAVLSFKVADDKFTEPLLFFIFFIGSACLREKLVENLKTGNLVSLEIVSKS